MSQWFVDRGGERVACYRLMWEDEFVGTVVPGMHEQPWFVGEVQVETVNVEILKFLRDFDKARKLDLGRDRNEAMEELYRSPFQSGWWIRLSEDESYTIPFHPAVDFETMEIAWRAITTLEFKSELGESGFLCHLARFPIIMDGLEWPTVEHYVQAMKFDDAAYRERIRRANSPAEAAKLGESPQHSACANWDIARDDLMRRALIAKFTQHEEIRKQLLRTGSATLVYASKKDGYWGDGGDGTGQNRLGELLMEVRELLRSLTQAIDDVAG